MIDNERPDYERWVFILTMIEFALNLVIQLS